MKPILSPLEAPMHCTTTREFTSSSWRWVLLIAALLGGLRMAAPAMARTEIAPRSAAELQEGASDIVLATVINRSVTETSDGDWLDRRFSFTFQIEDVLKGSLVRGDLIENVLGPVRPHRPRADRVIGHFPWKAKSRSSILSPPKTVRWRSCFPMAWNSPVAPIPPIPSGPVKRHPFRLQTKKLKTPSWSKPRIPLAGMSCSCYWPYRSWSVRSSNRALLAGCFWAFPASCSVGPSSSFCFDDRDTNPIKLNLIQWPCQMAHHKTKRSVNLANPTTTKPARIRDHLDHRLQCIPIAFR